MHVVLLQDAKVIPKVSTHTKTLDLGFYGNNVLDLHCAYFKDASSFIGGHVVQPLKKDLANKLFKVLV